MKSECSANPTPKVESSTKKENKLQKILRRKEPVQLTAEEYKNARLNAYASVR